MTTMMRASFLGLASALILGCGSSDDTADDTADDTGDDVADDTGDDTGDDTTDPGTPTAARLETLELRDPHLFALGGSFDVTTTVNDAIADGISMDADDPPDGQLDLSFLLVFRPWDLEASGGPIDAVAGANCAAPAGTSCTPNAEATVVEATGTNGDATCLAPGAGTTGDYDPSVTTPGGPCFSTDAHQVSLNLGTVALTLDNAQIAGTYSTSGHSVSNGLMIGFISEAAADAILLPEDLPLVGGDPLSSLLLEEDMDEGPGGVTGWWFYLNFTAGEVTYTE
jgi:hypothetical protein